MLLEEFYNYNGNKDRHIAQQFYIHTLICWMFNADLQFYESLLAEYERKEEYAVCEGINRAIQKIDDIMHDEFAEAEKLDETDNEILFTHEQHMAVNIRIVEEIIRETYEKQIDKHKENN